MNEVLLYGPIWFQSSIDFINAINAINANESDELRVRVNSGGGDVFSGWGMVSKFQEFEGKKSVIIDGQASSMALFFALYADAENVEIMDFAQGVLHRASLGAYYEENYMTESEAEFLKTANDSLYKATKNRINVEAFEELKGVKLKEVFSMDSRIDVSLSASDMKKIGLASKIINSTPKQKNKIEADYMKSIAAFGGVEFSVNNQKPEANNNQQINNNKQIQTTMTREELESQHPALFASIVNIGVEKGRKAEANRVGAWSAWSAIDPEAVKAGIESGEEITPKDTSEFQVKALNASNKAALEAEAARQAEIDAQNGNPPAAEGGEELTAAQKLEAEVMQKINPKTV